jgi:hypothetical protein
MSRCVTVPTVVNTVSNATVSVEKVSFSPGEKSIFSFFLQESIPVINTIMTSVVRKIVMAETGRLTNISDCKLMRKGKIN